MTCFALVHSPLVGPTTWQPVAATLAARGHRAVVPRLTDVLDGPAPYFAALANAVAEGVADAGEPVVLVAHSGAGPLLPAVCDALDRPIAPAPPGPPVTAAVFVDAGLPHPGRSWFGTAPRELADQLRELASDGMLPPWHRWFPPEAVAELLPDPASRDAVVRELRPVPVAFFEEPAPTTPALAAGRCAYLLLSDAYADAAKQASALDWPVARHPSDHLAIYTDAERVTEKLLTLAVGSGAHGQQGR